VVSAGTLSNNQYTFDVQWLVKHDLAKVFYYLYIRDDQKVVNEAHEGLAGGIATSHTVNAKYSLPASEISKTVKLTVTVTDIWTTIVKPQITCSVTLNNPDRAGLSLPANWQTVPIFKTPGLSTSIPDQIKEGISSGGLIDTSAGTTSDDDTSSTLPSGSSGSTPSGPSTYTTSGSSGSAAGSGASAPAAGTGAANTTGGTGSATGTNTGTSNTASTASAPPPLMPSPDILTCKGTAKTLYFENDAPAYDRMGSNCTLAISALVRAGIYSDAYDPKAEDNSANLIKALSLDTLKEKGRVYFSWNGYDDYDQPVAIAKYKLVVEAKPGTNFSPDISIHSFTIENAPEPAPAEGSQPGAATGEGTASAASGTAAATNGENLHGAAEENTAGELLDQLNQAIFGEGEGTEEKETVEARVASKCPNTFYPTDIAGHPYEALIKKAYDECLVRGYADGTFRVEHDLTRAEAAKIAVLASGRVAKQGCYDADCGSPFEDLEMWHGPWVRAAWDLKIVSGVGKNIFAPNRALTRAEAVALLMKAFNIQLHYGCYNPHCGAGLPDDPFTDIVQMWQGPYLRALWDKGVLHTLTPGRFYPDQAITRGQFIELVYLVKSLK
jgi:hypothetical protein